MDYVIAVQAPAYVISPTRFATESAFAKHLKELRQCIGSRFHRLVLIAPFLPEAEYQQQKAHLATLDVTEDGIVFVPAHPVSVSARRFWLSHARPLWRLMKQTVETAGVVHAGMSTDIWRPLLAMVNLAAWKAGRPVIFFVDIDFRKHSWRYYKLGIWNLKSYIVNRALHDPLKWLQCWLAPRMYSLVMLKSASMVRDFGRGRPNVKNFYDTAHSPEHVLSPEELRKRLTFLCDPTQPLHIVYFGRLVAYKGLDRAIDAVRLARERGVDVHFTIIGNGNCQASLRERVQKSKLERSVFFKPQVPYGMELFSQLEHFHLSVATPLVEDTPRSAFDSMARGIPILAFDITYFRDVAEGSGAVALAAWPSSEAFAQQLQSLNQRREEIAQMASRAVNFAIENTQQKWLEQRMRWTEEFALKAD